MIELPEHLEASDSAASGPATDGASASDAARLSRLIGFTTVRSSHEILSALLFSDHLGDSNEAPWNRYVFDHYALMVFPVSAAALHRDLTAASLQIGATMPSSGSAPGTGSTHAVIASTSCERTGTPVGLDPSSGTKSSIRPNPSRPPDRRGAARQLRRARDDERQHNRETHFAFTVCDFDSSSYSPLRRRLARTAGLVPDRGGFNPHDRIHGAGCSTFYFAGPGRVGGHRWPRRLELISGGRHDSALAAHQAEGSES
ncbi:hypothetical protein [Nocardia sp. CA-120079]|uniref:hypothetical protein n=1 Tax=Nocardia sp. CA-120079 TaxID=3239974 RepID=UPI003D9921CA